MGEPVRISEIAERSDIDRDDVVSADDLGSDWGDGFFVNQEPVLIKRDWRGEIARVIPLSELEAIREMERNAEMAEAAAKVVDPIPTPSKRKLTTTEREKLVFIMAKRLFDWYAGNQGDITMLNPLRDGIPKCPDHPRGCPLTRCELRGRPISKYYASPGEVLEWLVAIVSARARITDKRNNWAGYTPNITISREAK